MTIEALNELEQLTEKNQTDVTMSTGEVLLISEITIKELPKFAKLVKGLIPKDLDLDKIDTATIVEMALEDMDSLIELVSVSAKLKRDKLDTLGLDDLVLLASAVIEVNVDFFIKKVMPMIGKASKRIEEKLVQQSGQQ